MRLDPARKKCYPQQNEQSDGKYDTQSQKFDCTVSFAVTLYQTEQTCAQTDNNKCQKQEHNNFDHHTVKFK